MYYLASIRINILPCLFVILFNFFNDKKCNNSYGNLCLVFFKHSESRCYLFWEGEKSTLEKPSVMSAP